MATAVLAPAVSAQVGVPVSEALAEVLARTAPESPTRVFITADSVATATSAALEAGLTTIASFERFGMVVASGNAAAVLAAHHQVGVRRVDPDVPLEWFDDRAHRATGVAQLRDEGGHGELAALRRTDRTAYDGTGVSVAVVDSGFDTTHEQLVGRFDMHLRQACPIGHEGAGYLIGGAIGDDPTPDCSVWLPAPANDDSQAGHGTMTASVAGGAPASAASGATASGVAPGARMVGLSVGAVATTYNAFSALNWILEHHADPCGASSCPAIRVVSNSYGAPDLTSGPPEFDPDAPMNWITTALVRAGVVVVFAVGNTRGDGAVNTVSVFARNPEPGVLGVGAYHDGDAGDRDVGLGPSSTGRRGEPATFPDLVAPGAQYLTACPAFTPICAASGQADGAGYTVQNQGTSVAAPYVAGVVAQLLDANPALTPAEVEAILEKTAYQGFIHADLLEPDIAPASGNEVYGHPDHLTSFHAGHGLVDVVGAIAAGLDRGRRTAPEPCPTGAERSTVLDPSGDARTAWHLPAGSAVASGDITAVELSLIERPGALTAVIHYSELPSVDTRVRTTLRTFIDGNFAEVDLERTGAGETVTVFRGDVTAEVEVDDVANTATFAVRPKDGPAKRANALPYTSRAAGEADVDLVAGTCSIEARGS